MITGIMHDLAWEKNKSSSYYLRTPNNYIKTFIDIYNKFSKNIIIYAYDNKTCLYESNELLYPERTTIHVTYIDHWCLFPITSQCTHDLSIYIKHINQIYSGITCGRVLNG